MWVGLCLLSALGFFVCLHSIFCVFSVSLSPAHHIPPLLSPPSFPPSCSFPFSLSLNSSHPHSHSLPSSLLHSLPPSRSLPPSIYPSLSLSLSFSLSIVSLTKSPLLCPADSAEEGELRQMKDCHFPGAWTSTLGYANRLCVISVWSAHL